MKTIIHFYQVFAKKWRKYHLSQILILTSSLLILGCIGFFYYFSSKVDVGQLDKAFSQATVIYDGNGKVASKISANKTESVVYEQIPEHTVNAVVAIEDHRFFEHNGVDIIGIIRAFVRNSTAGGVVEGGSTITQQLTKNAFLSTEKTYKRKINEVFLARKIEKEFTKQEIMQMYLNTIYFGDGAWGIKRAAQHYFGKEVQDLTLMESALLAGLAKAPSALNPYEHLEKAIERRNVVLNQMEQYSYISPQQLEKAIKEKIVLNEKGEDPFRGKYPYYVDYVIQEAIEKYHFTQDELLTGGYQIYTELDQNKQEVMEEVYQDNSHFPTGTSEQIVQSGGILLDPKTGGIRALIGGRGEHIFRGYNRATQLIAQPGSTMKPLAVYAPAIENGWEMTDELKDEPYRFGTYEPKNYNDQYRGSMPMYEAVRDSVNIPAVWLLNEMGLRASIETLVKFGIPIQKQDQHLGIALGGMDKGVSPLTMAEAYSAFANNGEKIDGHAIVKIVAPTGEVIVNRKEKKTQVMRKLTAQKMTIMLMDVVENGTGRAARIPGREVAGKTGSTQVPITGINGVKDQWFVGYTPQLVGAIWVGYDKTDRDHYLTTTSSEGAAVVFQKVMQKAIENEPVESFKLKSVAMILEEKAQKERWKDIKEMEEKISKSAEKWRQKFEKEKKKWERIGKKHHKEDD